MTNVYAVYDTIAADVITLHAAKADAPAMRWFSDLLTQNQQLGAHAEDYHLIRVGAMDETQPRMSDETPMPRELILTGAQVRATHQTRQATE